MGYVSRRSLLRASLGAAAVGTLAWPYIANAAAKTATVWWTQGFIPSEDAAFRQLVADYEKTSGNTLNYSIIPFAPLRQKEISAITSGVVPDVMEDADFSFTPLNAWQDKLEDVSDIVETQKSQFSELALLSRNIYNNTTKKRSFYGVPMKAAAVPFHIWKSLVEKGGAKVSDIPDKWDEFIDFFKPLQAKLREQGMRHTYVYGWEVSTIGVDPINTFHAFMIAYGGKDLVTKDGKLHADDPQVQEAVIKALDKLTTDYKNHYVPPGVVNWNDADDNNAFHSKLCVIDFDGTISTELALMHNKEEFDDILTHGIPKGNDGKPLPAQVGIFGAVIPKGAKNLDVAREFLKYSIEPQVLNKYLKGGYGRWAIPMPGVAKSDSSFWLDPKAPHRKTYIEETLFGPTIPLYEAYNPASAQIDAEHVFQVAWADIVNHGMTAKAAAEKAFKRAEAIYAKYPIQQA